MSICANSKGESAHLHRLTLAFVKEPKSHVMPKMVICVLLTLAAKTLLCVASTFLQAGMNHIVTLQCDKYQDLLCWQ